jgi:phospholipid/cholesterol/gamma-HCH transport system substrate-binding protein
VETKAHHVTIGAFILIGVAAAFAFVIWIAKAQIERDTHFYDIFFTESVSGLSTASTVLYKGVNVGNIRNIRIDPEDPSRVRVRVELLASTPIREDAIAQLAFQGITGVSNIEITGGSANALPLMAKPGQEYPVIPSRPSVLQELLGGAPDLVNQLGVFVAELQKVVSPQNQKNFNDIMQNLSEITGGMAFRAENINRIIDNMDVAMQRFVTLSDTLDKLGTRTNALLDGDLPKTLATIREAGSSIHDLSAQLNTIVSSQKGAVTDFTSSTLPELGRFVEDARRLTKTLNQIASRVEENPSQFIFSRPLPEYRPRN